MKRFALTILLPAAVIFPVPRMASAAFEESLWEKYAEINTTSPKSDESLAGLYLDAYQFRDTAAKSLFSDLRVVTDGRDEMPWMIVTKRPELKKEEVQTRMRNLSHTKEGETWLELEIEKPDLPVNALEISTPDRDFSRQVQVLGSADGKNWNTLRPDGVIFDDPGVERLRHTRLTFPPSTFRTLAVKIADGGARRLTIQGVKVFRESESKEQTVSISGTITKAEVNASRKESIVHVRMNRAFPVERLVVGTKDRNFQRLVEVQTKRDSGEWETRAAGNIFNFDTPAMKESQMSIGIPEISTDEFRLVIRNLDSPPLTLTHVTGEGYRKLLIFKRPANQKLYLFWGNPTAKQPHYDLAGLVASRRPESIPTAQLGPVVPNPTFAGNAARLAFTERYKVLLYGVVAVAIAALIYLQLRVIRRVNP